MFTVIINYIIQCQVSLNIVLNGKICRYTVVSVSKHNFFSKKMEIFNKGRRRKNETQNNSTTYPIFDVHTLVFP